MSRSRWKGQKCICSDSVLKKVDHRYRVVSESLIGLKVEIHNGIEFKSIHVDRSKVGFAFGNFSITRKHTKKSLIKQKK